MDPRRLLTITLAGPALAGCALLGPIEANPLPPSIAVSAAMPGAPLSEADAAPDPLAVQAEVAVLEPLSGSARPHEVESEAPPADPTLTGRSAIAAANRTAVAASRADAFEGGVQVFAWAPGRIYEVWTAPLRVTTLTLGPGETLVSKAAGDTVRWQIGDTVSGAGAGQRTHVLLKPLERGLETNLVLTTNRRVYHLELRSGAADAFNAAVAWEAPWDQAAADGAQSPGVPTDVVMPEGVLDGRYRIQAEGRRPRWTPTSVFNDGRRTFITFDADLQIDEAPALFVIAPDGETQLVNYRQQGGLFVVDRVFDRAELRLGDRRPQIVRLLRLQGARP